MEITKEHIKLIGDYLIQISQKDKTAEDEDGDFIASKTGLSKEIVSNTLYYYIQKKGIVCKNSPSPNMIINEDKIKSLIKNFK
jgi:hypothetical protein